MTTDTKALQKAPKQKTELAAGEIDEQTLAALQSLDDLARTYSLQTISGKGRMEQALLLARGTQALRSAMNKFMADFLALYNNPLGYRCDRPNSKNPQPYSEHEVRDCLIEGILRGLYPVGNEINIISGRCYATKEGYTRLLRDLQGFANLQMTFGVPRMADGGAVVTVGATWQFRGQSMSLRDEEGKPGRRFAVRLNAGMGADAALGKAERKAKAAIYAICTGSDWAHVEAAEVEAVTAIAENGKPALAETLKAHTEPATAEQKARLADLLRQHEIDEGDYLFECAQVGADPSNLTVRQAQQLIAKLGGPADA